MKNVITLLLFTLLLLGKNGKAAEFTTIEQKGKEIINLFVDKKFSQIEGKVAALYKSYYSATTFERDWNELLGTYGAFQSFRTVNFENYEHYTFIAFRIKFEYLPYVMNLSFNDEGELIYISFMQAHKIYVAPEYCDLSKFTERKLVTRKDFYELPGTLTMPVNKGKSPLVIILVEAGPTDRDGSYEENKPYKDIAWGLASKGFAVYRYEKRSNVFGIYLAKDKAAYEKFTPREDLLDDLYQAIDTLKTLPDVDKNNIYILGHGQGGMLAPLVAKERHDVKGIIMMGANAKKTQEMMIDQYQYLSKVTPNKKPEYDLQTKNAIRSMDKKLNPITEHDKMPYGVQATYWIWLNNYKHVEIAKKLKKPIFILHGDRDYQTNMQNFEIWQKELGKNENVQLKNYPKLNHLFYSGEVESTYSEYFMMSNIPDYVIKDLTDWLSSH